ncbi:hypothetical protein T06_4003, partial [Trichinella sp. T6]
MLASNTFALNEMRNQNAISESKLFRTDDQPVKQAASPSYVWMEGYFEIADRRRSPQQWLRGKSEEEENIKTGRNDRRAPREVKYVIVCSAEMMLAARHAWLLTCYNISAEYTEIKDRHDENRASTSIQLAHLTRKSSKHGSEDYGYDGEGADDGRERKPEENLPLMLLRYITLNIT